MTYELGVDVSKWQTPEKVDWQRLKTESNIKFVIARYSYGMLVDSTFWRHGWQAMRVSGIALGAYQYLVPTQDAQQQAGLALQIARQLDMPFVLDVEARGLTAKQIDAWLNTFARANASAMIYCSQTSWRECYGAGAHKWSHLPLWVANYTEAAKPAMPDGWQDWAIWQHSQNGRLAGYSGALDLNRRKLK